MAETTGIEWCDATWNPWTGCTKVSPGCDNCYMYRQKERWGHDPSKVVRSAPKTFNLPLAKNRDGSWKIPSGSFVFVCSWSDFFHEEAKADWARDAENIMLARRDLRFLILTKRIEDFSWSRVDSPHIWLGVTAENQALFDERWPILNRTDWPGHKFLSYEPAIGPLVLPKGALAPVHGALDWVIVGGESGPNNREIKLDWVRSMRDQCVEAGVPFFLKQYSGVRPAHMPELDGKVWDQRPGV